MLDIKKVRDKTDWVRDRLATRGQTPVVALQEWIQLDERWRLELGKVENLKAEKNRLAKEVGVRKQRGENTEDLFVRAKEVAAAIDVAEQGCTALENECQNRALLIPNTPHESVPEGQSAEENVEVGQWGQKPTFSFAPQNHVALGEKLGILDFTAAAKISGSGFVVYRAAGAKLERALIQFLLDLHTREHGYTEISPPFLVHRQSMIGTGQLPKFEEDMYAISSESELFLAPTAEVPVTNLHREELLKESQLPLFYVAYTPCFRREAGSSGRETHGLVRMHQFDKVELVKIVHPNVSYDELEKLRRNAERVLELLGLHYRTIVLCTGDMGFGAAKCYDIEVWAPGEGRYLEVSSCSSFEDFQARRMNLRFKATDGKNHFCHTLNGSGTALARLVVALLETYQQPDGSIKLPEVLLPYMGGDIHLKNV